MYTGNLSRVKINILTIVSDTEHPSLDKFRVWIACLVFYISTQLVCLEG